MKYLKQLNLQKIAAVGNFLKKRGTNNKVVSNNKIITVLDRMCENLLRRIRISYRLIASFLLLSLIPILVIGAVSINRSSAAMEENVSRYSIEIAKELGTGVSAQLKTFSDTLLEVAMSKNISSYVDSINHKDDLLLQLNAMKELENYLSSKSYTTDIDAIGYIPANGDREIGGKNIIIRENKYGIYDKIMQSDSKGEWIYMDYAEKDQNNTKGAAAQKINMPVYFRCAVNTSSQQNLGVVYLVPKKDSLNKIISDVNLDDAGEGDIFVMNNENIVIASSNDQLYGKLGPDEIVKKLDSVYKTAKDASNIQPGYFRTSINGIDNLVSYSYLNQEGWKVVTTVPFGNLMKKTEAIRSTVLTVGIFCFIAALLISYMVTRSVSIPLGHINNAVEGLKKGDFTKQLNVKFNDEISVLSLNFNSMVNDVRAMIRDVKKITGEVVTGSEKIENHSAQSLSASEQIAEAVSEIAAGSSEQALESQKGKENIDALADKLNLIVEGTSSVQKATGKTKNLCEDSINVVNNLNSSAKEANAAAETIVTQINNLNQDMKQINNIMKVILNIADQTNLLALNAAIEAARAGEAGRGFAVVADEVKKLAEQSKNASSSISSIITNIMKRTSQVVDAANGASESIQKQTGAVKQTDETFRSIVSATEEIVVQLDNMNSLIKSMDTLKNTTVSSMESISGISQSAAAATEEVNATTEEQIASANQLADLSKDLNELAVSLEQSTIKFKV